MTRLHYWWLWFQAAMHRIDAHLAYHRHELAFCADCISRANALEREMFIINLNRRMK